ncbi:hypothetical protein [Streptomyces sp. Y1]|uniref:Lipoprotein n=1 Tax=Streptomyces sp. Y1 TaxID=3238634 RepID=A0AB39TEK5_9ACTN
MTIRRTTAVPVLAATALALTALTGCGSGGSGGSAPAAAVGTASASASASVSATATASATAAAVGAPAGADGAFDPAVAIAHRSREPYAANVVLVSETGEGDQQVRITVTGRMNYYTPARGARTEGKTVMGGALVLNWMETLTADGVGYHRDKAKGETKWTKDLQSGEGADANGEQVAGYAKALLETGPAARKGMETELGLPVFHLAGRLTMDQVREADPSNAARMAAQGVDGVDCELWIDRLGRGVRGVQSMVVNGKTVVTKDQYSNFGPADTFAAPLPGEIAP